MYIRYLKLLNFRNYQDLKIEFTNGINILTGDNAQGKTNILESIYYCAIGKSHRTNKDKDLINWSKQESFINAYISTNRLDKKIELKIFKEGKKGININGIKVKKINELLGNFYVVMFAPEDLKIVKESPSYRRKFLDMEICKLSNKYYNNLVEYKKILAERNTVLKNWNNNYDMLDIYDDQLSRVGMDIIKYRISYLNELKKSALKIHSDITNCSEEINFKYITDIKGASSTHYDFNKLLKLNRNNDINKKITNIGPHRDDFSIEINGIDTRHYGSQGQQRTAILTIKFASLNVIKNKTGEYPVLLLDDVLSELDINRQKYIISAIENVQTIITCTNIEDIKKYISNNAKVFRVRRGSIENI